MTTYTDSNIDNLVTNINKAYFRTFYEQDDENGKNNVLNYTTGGSEYDCDRDFYNILNSSSPESVMFYLDTNKNKEDVYLLCLITDGYYSNPDNVTPKYIGHITKNESGYTFDNSTTGMSLEYTYTTRSVVDNTYYDYEFTILNENSENPDDPSNLGDSQGTVYTLTVDDGGNLTSDSHFTALEQGKGSLFSTIDFSNTPFLDDNNNPNIIELLQDLCIYENSNGNACVIDNILSYQMEYKYAGEDGAQINETKQRPNGLPATTPNFMIKCIDKTCLTGIPTSNVNNYNNIEIVFGHEYDPLVYIFRFKITGSTHDSENNITYMTGLLGQYNGVVFQNVTATCSDGSYGFSITMNFENGFDSAFTVGCKYIFVIYLNLSDITPYDADIRQLMYEKSSSTAALTKGSKYSYVDKVSSIMKNSTNGANVPEYSQFNELYKYNEGVETTTVVDGYNINNNDILVMRRNANRNYILYKLKDDVRCITKGSTDLVNDQVLKEDISIGTNSDINIYKDTTVGSSKYVLNSKTATITPIDYFVVTSSVVSFQDDERYLDLSEYYRTLKINGSGTKNLPFCRNSGTSGSGENEVNVISVFGEMSTKFLCTMKEYDLFVSFCFNGKQEIPMPSAPNDRKPATLTDGTYTILNSDFKLLSYNEDYIPSGFSAGVGESEITSSTNKVQIYMSKSGFNDKIVYIQIPITNVDTVISGDKSSFETYFDINADAIQNDNNEYEKRKFYVMMILDGSKPQQSGEDPIADTFTLKVITGNTATTEIKDYYGKVVDSTTGSFKFEVYDGTTKIGDVTFGETSVMTKGILLPINTELTSIDDDSERNVFPLYDVMAVYTKTSSPSPEPTQPVSSSIKTYNNKCYLEEGEYNTTGYSSALAGKLTNPADLQEETNLDWTAYSKIYVAYEVTYQVASSSFKRLFTVMYEMDSGTVTKLTMYKFSNLDSSSVLEECCSVEMNVTPTITGNGTETSTFKVDITINHTGTGSDSITYANYWYNHVEGTVGTVTLHALLGVE